MYFLLYLIIKNKNLLLDENFMLIIYLLFEKEVDFWLKIYE